ncbi:MAG: aminotransferase class V-fold PLP-dependent enzyme [Oscillospiraceae bacterium]|nr:aminotransferase class V-fold PLP-dependent enzyme [Oscillospiraceae bacterium]
MNTPICDFVKQYARKEALRLHMPGHKGKGSGAEQLDITEIDGADVLYAPNGIIRQSQELAAELFGTAMTVYSTEGSSLAIRAMLYLAMLYGKQQGRTARILAGRNAHKTFMTAVALLDLEPVWLQPREGDSLLSCSMDKEDLEAVLCAMEEKPVAVYVTAPDYLGNMVDIGSLSEVCHRHGVLLLVDNAHGAYLRFLPQSLHPMDLGADLCCDSAHKTLPVLTGGAYLHISKDAPELFSQQVLCAMSMFASTSPSYLILQSLDACNAYLSEGYAKKLEAFVREADALKCRLTEHGFDLVGEEPLKLTISPKSFGYRGTELGALLEQKNIVCEFADPDYVVLMLTPELEREELQMLEKTLLSIEPREPIKEWAPALPRSVKRMSVREALFSPSEERELSQCCGEILANASITCPPAIPVLICGEEITAEAQTCLKYYGVERCRVVHP